VEGLGDKRQGYHKIQDQIVNFSGTQCGFCTPGMVKKIHHFLVLSFPTVIHSFSFCFQVMNMYR